MRLIQARELTLDDAIVEALQLWVWKHGSAYGDTEYQVDTDGRVGSALAVDPVRRWSWNAIDATLALLRSSSSVRR
jgi:hypothetical protein